MNDETITTKQEWYDVTKYKDEIQQFVKGKRAELDVTSNMEKTYNTLYRIVYAGTEEGDVERFPYAAESFKIYKSALIESCLQGYSALLEISGNDGQSTLKTPQLKQVMTDQFKGMALLEKLSGDTLDDWILKGEAVSFIKLKTNREEYRVRQVVTDENTGEEIIKFSLKQGVSYDNLEIERIDPLDFFVDGVEYQKDPIGCTKIVRSYIDAKTLLTSDAYPLLTTEDKRGIIERANKNGNGLNYFSWGTHTSRTGYSRTDKEQIEVLTFYGDFITSDNKVLCNIKATLVGNQIAFCKYNGVSTQRIIYAPYKIDRLTHRSISPLASTQPVNKLANRAIDMFLKNLDDVSNPWLLYQKGTISKQQVKEARKNKELEYIDNGAAPQFWTPNPAPVQGLDLINMIVEQSKNTLGLNQYMAGDTSGSVRTARESAILFQKANARMRVETDVFSYRFMLPLFNSFYAFNRELALVAQNPLNPIYADETLNVSISTNASRADKEGEMQRLMQMLQLPIAQMIFSNLQPDQVVLAVRYLMAKAELTDGDNLLELIDSAGNPTEYVDPQQQMDMQQQQVEMMNDMNNSQGGQI